MPKLKTSMKSAKRVFFVAGLFLCIALPAHSLARGHLAPFCPWVIGFEHRDFERARVYFHAGAPIELFGDIDHLITDVEASHGMLFPRKVEIVVSASDAEHMRLASTGARFQVMPLYGRLFVSKRALDDARSGTIHLDVYLRHELSHSLLFQHMTLTSAVRCPDWLLEGLAVYTSNQRGCDGYFKKDEVGRKMKEGYFLHPSDFNTKPWQRTSRMKSFPLPNKYWFLYSEMACLIDDLVQTHGRNAFHVFLNSVIKGENARTCFMRVYGEAFDAYVESFRGRMVTLADDDSCA